MNDKQASETYLQRDIMFLAKRHYLLTGLERMQVDLDGGRRHEPEGRFQGHEDLLPDEQSELGVPRQSDLVYV